MYITDLLMRPNTHEFSDDHSDVWVKQPECSGLIKALAKSLAVTLSSYTLSAIGDSMAFIDQHSAPKNQVLITKSCITFDCKDRFA